MSTTDMSFLFVFLPLVLCACFMSAKFQKYILLVFSLFFYACGSPKYFLLFVGMVVVNIVLSYIMQACNKKSVKSLRIINSMIRCQGQRRFFGV